MFQKIDRMYLVAKLRLKSFIDDIRSDERGVSNIVATVILILIVVLLAAIYFAYQDRLLVDATKKAIDAQKEIWLNMPEKCKDCPYCRLKEERK